MDDIWTCTRCHDTFPEGYVPTACSECGGNLGPRPLITSEQRTAAILKDGEDYVNRHQAAGMVRP